MHLLLLCFIFEEVFSQIYDVQNHSHERPESLMQKEMNMNMIAINSKVLRRQDRRAWREKQLITRNPKRFGHVPQNVIQGDWKQFLDPAEITPALPGRIGLFSDEPQTVPLALPQYNAWFGGVPSTHKNYKFSTSKKHRTESLEHNKLTNTTTEVYDATIGSLAFLNDKDDGASIDYWNYLFAVLKTGKDFSKRQLDAKNIYDMTAVPIEAPMYDKEGKKQALNSQEKSLVPLLFVNDVLENYTKLASDISFGHLTAIPIPEPAYDDAMLPVVRKDVNDASKIPDILLNNRLKTTEYIRTDVYASAIPITPVKFYERQRQSTQNVIKSTARPTIPPQFDYFKPAYYGNNIDSIKLPPNFHDSRKGIFNDILKFKPLSSSKFAPELRWYNKHSTSKRPIRKKTQITLNLITTEPELSTFSSYNRRQHTSPKIKFVFRTRKTTTDIFGEVTPIIAPVFVNETVKPPPLDVQKILEKIVPLQFIIQNYQKSSSKPTEPKEPEPKLPKELEAHKIPPLMQPPIEDYLDMLPSRTPNVASRKSQVTRLHGGYVANPLFTLNYGDELDDRPVSIEMFKKGKFKFKAFTEYNEGTASTPKETKEIDETMKIFYNQDSAYKGAYGGEKEEAVAQAEERRLKVQNVLAAVMPLNPPATETYPARRQYDFRQRKRKTTTTPVQLDIPALMDIIENLTQGWSGNLVEMLNQSLQQQSIPTCPALEYDDDSDEDSSEPYSNFHGLVMGKCFVCGMQELQMPFDAHCADAFASEVVPMVRVDPTARGKLAGYKKYCRWKNIPGYLIKPKDPRNMWGRWTGGCSVRWVDISGMYTQRTCRNTYRPAMGKHWASKRMAKLELALQHLNNGCIISPVASLVPLSRAISLYARFHACVCTGSWCNRSSLTQQWTAYFVMLGFTTAAVLIKCLLIAL